jgi:cell division protein FtsQ
VSHDLVNLPHARNWRDIPQEVKPRAMSREGQWRVIASGLRMAGFVVAVLLVGWGVWEVAQALQENPKRMPTAAKSVPVKHLALRTDGRLDAAWLGRALALPKNASLMELDLLQLRSRLLADGQVRTATVARNFPDTLDVQLTEREPVIRLRADLGGDDVRTLLVAKDGVVFEGTGYDYAKLDELPWLAPGRLARSGKKILPIAGMNLVAELLDRAQRETAPLYAQWKVVSLAALESDGEIHVQTKTGTVVVFGANADFFPQLAKLDALSAMLTKAPTSPARIDLSLGREVPVSFGQQAAAAVPTGNASSFQLFPTKLNREL